MGTPVGFVQVAKRSLVKVLLALAVVYNVTLSISHDSADAGIPRAYKKVVLKTHPDKGGTVTDHQKSLEANEAWEGATADSARPVRCPEHTDCFMTA